MGLSSLIRNAVANADSVTKDLQVNVTHEAWISDGTTYNEPLYDGPITRKAIVEMAEKMFHNPAGQDTVQKAVVTFIGPIAANGADGRREPVDLRDRITLPTGYTGPILRVEGILDPKTNAPYATEVTLG